jgi:glutathione reductase (NADPH)
MSDYDYDLFTIGAGSGGVRASRMSAGFGARVGICEEAQVGGTCVIRGCVPKKLLVYGAHVAHDIEDAAGYGWDIPASSFSWPQLITAKNKEIDRLNGIYKRILREAGVDLLEGRGVLLDEHTVRVGEKTVTAEKILIAVGGWPYLPDIPGIEHAITSNEALDLMELPRRIAIVGGGYIAVEFAGIFNALGVEVVEIMRGDTVLRGFDEDLRLTLAEEMTKAGIELRTECVVRSIEKTQSGYSLRFAHGDELETDLVMYATGRKPNTAGLGLDALGVKTDKNGAIKVDAQYRSSVKNIHALGDVTDRVNLTPVATAEGTVLARRLFGPKGRSRPKVDYADIPSAVFSQPPLATAGLTEAEARAKFDKVDIYVSRFKAMKHTLSGRDERSFMKLVVDGETDRVLGCHMVGADAPEIVQGLAIALKANATKAQFDATIGIHPTAAEEFVTMREKLPEHGE